VLSSLRAHPERIRELKAGRRRTIGWCPCGRSVYSNESRTSSLSGLPTVGVRRDTIYTACERGELRHGRIGGGRKIVIRPQWIDAWLERQAPEVQGGPRGAKTINESGGITGGEAGIRILKTRLSKWLMARDFWL
jgi:hypothetical protein